MYTVVYPPAFIIQHVHVPTHRSPGCINARIDLNSTIVLCVYVLGRLSHDNYADRGPVLHGYLDPACSIVTAITMAC